jgi:methylthioribose-1-phosphate isomerase
MAASSSSSASSMLQSLKYSRSANTLEVLDQLLVPHETTYVAVAGSEDAWGVIRRMQVRGAPLIAIVAALGLSVEAQAAGGAGGALGESGSAEAAASFLLEKMTYLRTSRPTAVNLFAATDELSALVRAAAAAENATAGSVLGAYSDAAEAMLEADVSANRAIGRFGAEAILAAKTSKAAAEAGAGASPVVSVMTICNTGSLATAGYGTALGVVRALHEAKALRRVFACETYVACFLPSVPRPTDQRINPR